MTNSPGGIQAGRDVVINQERRLTDEQRTRFLTIVRADAVKKGLIVIEIPMGDSEAYKFAMQLDSMLREAGWETSVGQNGYASGVPIGLIMLARAANNAPASAGLLQYAFGQIGFKLEAALRDDVQPGNLHLIVGARPLED